jgi:anti-anti-sigma factor
MTATVVSGPPSATVVLGGEIDIAAAPAIRRLLLAAISGRNAHLAVDLSGVTFLGAAGIGVLVAAANRARETGGSLSLLAPSRQVQRLLRRSRPPPGAGTGMTQPAAHRGPAECSGVGETRLPCGVATRPEAADPRFRWPVPRDLPVLVPG